MPGRKTMSPYAAMSEAKWQAQVIDAAQTMGWSVYHTHNSRHSAAGFPDLTMVRPPRLIFAELKIESRSAKGQATPAQVRWLGNLGHCPGIEVYLWRPSDCDQVWRILR